MNLSMLFVASGPPNKLWLKIKGGPYNIKKVEILPHSSIYAPERNKYTEICSLRVMWVSWFCFVPSHSLSNTNTSHQLCNKSKMAVSRFTISIFIYAGCVYPLLIVASLKQHLTLKKDRHANRGSLGFTNKTIDEIWACIEVYRPPSLEPIIIWPVGKLSPICDICLL